MIITNARIFDGKKFIKENTVEIKKNIIKKIFFAKSKIKGKNIIDLKGKILAPGLIDIHAHGAGGINSIEIKNKNDLRIIKEGFAKIGTTTVVLTTVYSFYEKEHLRLIKKYNDIKYGAKIAGIYLESPFVNINKRGMIKDEYVRKDTDNFLFLVKDINKICGNFLKIITIAPETKDAEKIMDYFNNKKINIAFGHSKADYDTVKKYSKKYIKVATHFLNAMNLIHHREPGPAVALVENQNIFLELIADGNHIHPAIIKLIYNLAGKDRIILITDATGDKILKDGIYENKRYGKIIVKNNGVYSLNGFLIGTNLSLLDMCKNIKKWLSLKIEDVLQMVTYNPHKLLNIKAGVIKQNYYADFVVLDDKLNLYGVFVNGKMI